MDRIARFFKKCAGRPSPDPGVSQSRPRPRSPPPPAPEPTQPMACQPRPRLVDDSFEAQARRIPRLPAHEPVVIPHRDDAPARDQVLSSILAHGLPGHEGAERAMKKRTGHGIDHIWDDIQDEYEDSDAEPCMLRRSNAVKPRVNRWRRDDCNRELRRPAGKVVASVADPATKLRADSCRQKVVAPVAALVDGPATKCRVACKGKQRVAFEDEPEESAAERAEQDGWFLDCVVNPCCPPVQQVGSIKTPTLVEQDDVESLSGIIEGADDEEQGVEAEEEGREVVAEGGLAPQGSSPWSNQASVDDLSEFISPNWDLVSNGVRVIDFALPPQVRERAWWGRRLMEHHWLTSQLP